MPPNLLILLILAGGGFAFYRWLQRNHPTLLAQYGRKFAMWGGLGVLLLLAASGRLNWLTALIGSLLVAGQRLLPLLRLAPLAQQLHGRFRSQQAAQQGPHSGQRSSVETDMLNMTLDHDSGQMSGTVTAGRFRGRQVESMPREELLALYQECVAADQHSASVLEAYLDRTQGEDWRDQYREFASSGGAGRGDSVGATMNVAEAYEVLGLHRGASKEEIRQAHRRLMQKMHPDRGGSDYLAAKINQAKKLLLSA